MGAWGAGSFENDSALDWIGDLLESKDASLIRATLNRAMEHDDTKRTSFLGIVRRRPEKLPADVATQALAAAEIVAAWHGQPLAKLPKGTAEWLKQHMSSFEPKLVALAQQAVNEVKTNSELKALWEEGDASQWQNAVMDLEQRLSH